MANENDDIGQDEMLNVDNGYQEPCCETPVEEEMENMNTSEDYEIKNINR
jgi:hypothetical protein